MTVSRFSSRLAGVLVGALLGWGGLSAGAGTLPADSLRRVLRRPDLPDTLRVRAHHDLFWELITADPAAAGASARTGLALARRGGYVRGQLACLNDLGTLAERLGDYPEALRQYGQAQALAYRTRQFHKLWYTLTGQASIALRTGDHARAVRLYEEALRQVRRLKPVPRASEAELLSALGSAYEEVGRVVESVRISRQAVRLNREIGNTSGLIMSLSNLAGRLRERHPDSTVLLLRDVAAMAHRFGDTYSEAVAWCNLSQFLLEAAQLPEAGQAARRALVLVHGLGSPDLRMQLLRALALVEARRAHFPAAYHALDSAIQVLDTLKNQELLEQTSQAQVRLDVARKEYQLRELRQQRRIGQLEADRQRLGLYGLSAVVLLLGGGVVTVTRSRRQLQRSEAALRVANRTKDQLMTIIGHDLRAPVAAFQQITPRLRPFTRAQPELAPLAGILESQADRLGGLLDNLLHWARAQSGQVACQPTALSAAGALGSLVTLYEPLAATKGVTLRLTPPAPDLYLWADYNLLATVVRNLLSNAVKFTPAGGGVTLRAWAAEGRGWVEVRDTGVGLGPERLARLFEAGEGESTRGTAGEPGTGLGLPLSARFVALLGGELRAESAPGVGTRFWFGLPLADA